MRLLLDTHAFLWWVTDAPQLSKPARTLISNERNEVFFSAASAWEIVIKAQLGRVTLRSVRTDLFYASWRSITFRAFQFAWNMPCDCNRSKAIVGTHLTVCSLRKR
jgi:PIN domain nuclease of toxin-antitoxin system